MGLFFVLGREVNERLGRAWVRRCGCRGRSGSRGMQYVWLIALLEGRGLEWRCAWVVGAVTARGCSAYSGMACRRVIREVGAAWTGEWKKKQAIAKALGHGDYRVLLQ